VSSLAAATVADHPQVELAAVPAALPAPLDRLEWTGRSEPRAGGSHRRRLSTAESVRSRADHSPMEATLRLLTWAGVVAAASVAAALGIGAIFGAI
jgi:hypothetical protein